ncbi:Sjogren's syndrome/scleroderma autoantigen 1 family protein [Halosimplex marinum]
MSGQGQSTGEETCPDCSAELVQDGPKKYYCVNCGYSRNDRV